MNLLAILGQTASGKSAVALEVAQAIGGEIICADSRQVYRGMDVGTAKPTKAEQQLVPHHLFDIADPGETVGLAEWLAAARRTLDHVWSRGRTPIIVGGTPQYAWALLEGWEVPPVPPQPVLRAELEERAAREGPAALHRELAAIDPDAAARIDPRNIRRTVRALEVHAVSGRPFSSFGRGDPAFRWMALAIDAPRDELYRRIDERVRQMFAGGLIREARRLQGLPEDSPAMTAIGYREAQRHVRGEIAFDEAVELTALATHRLARAQATWFRKDDARIQWLRPEDAVPAAVRIWEQFAREAP